MERETTEELLDGYFDGQLTPTELAELRERLRGDAAVRQAYWDAAQTHAALSLWGEQQAGTTVPEAGWPQPAGLASPRWRARLAWGAGIAAALLVGAGVIFWPRASAEAARITYAGGAAWSLAGPDESGRLGPGEHRLGAGHARFETVAGAAISVAAPARFRLRATGHVDLLEGRLTARMLREDARLTVYSGGLEITDLGTAFGVEAGGAGRTLVSVFDGEVAVKGGGGGKLRLTQGQSAVGGGGAARGASYDPHAFRELWPLTVGIDDASSIVEFLPPGPLLNPLRDYRADGKLFLLPERQKAALTRRLPLDLAPTAPNWPDSQVSPYPLEPGGRVNSYLLFFQPAVGTPGLRHLKGRITFQGRVLGVICSDQGLTLSDAAVGLPQADYSTPRQRRGLEEADKENYRGATLPHDSIRLSQDGRTVEFDFHVSDEREQMRILVAADPASPQP